MKIFNKVIWVNKEPINKNDIWYNGESFLVYKGNGWEKVDKDASPDWEAKEGEDGFIKNKPFNFQFTSDEDYSKKWENSKLTPSTHSYKIVVKMCVNMVRVVGDKEAPIFKTFLFSVPYGFSGIIAERDNFRFSYDWESQEWEISIIDDEDYRSAYIFISNRVDDVQPLDEAYISDAIARKEDILEQIQVDWSQNDSTSKDYIKNRTHYVTITDNSYNNPYPFVDWTPENETASTIWYDEYSLFDGDLEPDEGEDLQKTFYLLVNYSIKATGSYEESSKTKYLKWLPIECWMYYGNDKFNGTIDVTKIWGDIVDTAQGWLSVYASCAEINIADEEGDSRIPDLAQKTILGISNKILPITFGGEIITPIDEKFIPNTIARKTDISDSLWDIYINNLEVGDRLFTNKESYYKYIAAKDNYVSASKVEYNYSTDSSDEPVEVSWEEYGFTWNQFVAIKDNKEEWVTNLNYTGDSSISVTIYGPDDEEGFTLTINPNTETILNIGY